MDSKQKKIKFACCYCGSHKVSVEVFKEKDLSPDCSEQDVMDVELVNNKHYRLSCAGCFRVNYVCDNIFQVLMYLGLR